jgi:PTH1 family peptidyl-tRNA hydrolase
MTILLVGLGNPDKQYAVNRHNIGFMAVDALASALKASDFRAKFSGLMAEATAQGEKIFLFKPQTYMNRSGIPTSELAQFYKIVPEDIIVFHDELDLPFTKLRIKQGGGNGGHNGLKSLDEHLGENYWRVRLGIGHPGNKDMVSSYVLSDFDKAEQPALEQFIKSLAAQASKIIHKDMNAVTNEMALETVKK